MQNQDSQILLGDNNNGFTNTYSSSEDPIQQFEIRKQAQLEEQALKSERDREVTQIEAAKYKQSLAQERRERLSQQFENNRRDTSQNTSTKTAPVDLWENVIQYIELRVPPVEDEETPEEFNHRKQTILNSTRSSTMEPVDQFLTIFRKHLEPMCPSKQL